MCKKVHGQSPKDDLSYQIRQTIFETFPHEVQWEIFIMITSGASQEEITSALRAAWNESSITVLLVPTL